MHRVILLFCLATAPVLAEPALNPAAIEATINETICTPYYAARVRLPWYTMARIKLRLLKERGESWLDAPKYELDHIIPLCLGGAAGDLSNLQLQPWEEAKKKDRVEGSFPSGSLPRYIGLDQGDDRLGAPSPRRTLRFARRWRVHVASAHAWRRPRVMGSGAAA